MSHQKLPSTDLIHGLIQLGEELADWAVSSNPILEKADLINPWFTITHLQFALKAWSEALNPKSLTQFLSQYPFLMERMEYLSKNMEKIQTIGLIMAGNIPLVGFHDLLTTLISGNKAEVKLSSGDSILIPFIAHNFLEKIPQFKGKVLFTERLKNFNAVIATGSNNSSRYFEYYFGSYPHIIRKNRHSLAILTGQETEAQIRDLGKDLFQYFGLGCRNVSKLFLPRDFNFIRFLDILETYRDSMSHHKYLNNVAYQNALLQLNQSPHFQNGFLFLKEDLGLSSPISVVFYEFYDPSTLAERIHSIKDQIQCIVGCERLVMDLGIDPFTLPQKMVYFGKTQYPELWDYADGVDTLAFLLNLINLNT